MQKKSSLPKSDDDDDESILEMDTFVKTLAGINANGVRPDIIGSIIAHYASKWLPELSTGTDAAPCSGVPTLGESPLGLGSVTALWMKKRFIAETLVGMLPPEKGSVPCNFLLRLLRTGNAVGVGPTSRAELECRISRLLEEASLKELMIPSFCHTCGTLLDVELVIRLVKKFVNFNEAGESGAAALAKVAMLVDGYLAEAAVDSNLGLPEFVALARALPGHARARDDGLYRAIDTYLKAHPSVPKHERKSLCRLLDGGKLSPEACHHAADNERLPVRSVIQVLFSKPIQPLDWSSLSFSGLLRTRTANRLDAPGRSLSRREGWSQQLEIKKLREDVVRLQKQCRSMQEQVEKLSERKKGFFRWRKLGMPSLKSIGLAEKNEEGGEREAAALVKPLPDMKTKLIRCSASPKQWRKSM